MVTNFWAESAKLPYPSSFIALALQNGLEDRNADVNRLNSDKRSTSDKNIASFCQVTSEVTRLNRVIFGKRIGENCHIQPILRIY